MRIIMIHGVGGYDCPEATFRDQLLYLKRYFHIVSMDELIELRKSGRNQISGREVAITFDDGMRNNLTIAYPVLDELKVPATFYVCPGLIEKGGWLWNHECRARLSRLAPRRRLSLAIEAGVPLEDVPVINLVEWMKELPRERRKQVEAMIRAATPQFEPNPLERHYHDLMSWQDLAQLDPARITIGAHTVTHPILTTLTPAEIEDEISGSRRLLEERLNRPVRHFCYPNGLLDPQTIECVKANFDSGVTTENGWVEPDGDPYQLPRIPVAPDLALMAWRLYQPGA